MGGLEDRLRRLENEAARAGVPSWAEYEGARTRQWARIMLLAFSKMPGEERSRQRLSKENRALLEGDTEEQRKGDSDVIARYEEAHGVSYDLDAIAEQARQKLREVGRSE